MGKKNRLFPTFWTLLLALLLCVVCVIPAFAAEIPQSIEVPVIQADTAEELFNAFAEIENDSISPRAAIVTIGVARNYSTGESCEVYLNWTGTARYNGWRFKKASITNGSSLNEVFYDAIGTGSSYKTYNVNSASTGTVSLGMVEIPTSVSRVYVSFTSLQGSLSANSDWNSVSPYKFWSDII